jgi:hypothetical protein
MHEVDIPTDDTALLGPDGPVKDAARAKLRAALLARLGPLLRRRRPGFVILFGYESDPEQGNLLAIETAQQIKHTFRRRFNGAVIRPFHYITADPTQQGVVELDIYLLTR